MILKPRLIIWLAILLLLRLAPKPLAYAEQLPVNTYTIANGLAHDEINKIYRDSRGFLWFCTIDGLSRFDGYRFTNYTSKEGLPSSYVHDILESRTGDYWVATSAGVSRFNPLIKGDARAKFTTYSTSGVGPQGAVYVLYEDRAGSIWAGTPGGLFRLESGAGAFQRVRLGIESKPDEVVEISALMEDRDGSLWMGTTEGLIRRAPDGRMIHYPLRAASDFVWALLEDNNGTVWVGHQTGLFVFKPQPAPNGEADNALEERSLLLEQEGANSSPKDAMSLPTESGQARWFTTADGLAYNNVHALYQSTDGRIYIGTVGGGLTVLDGTRFRTYAGAQGLSNKITALAEDSAGNMWVGTQAGGAKKIARSGFISYGGNDGLGNTDIVQIFEDLDRELVVISGKWTINRFDGERFTSFRPNLPQQIINSSSGRWEILQDHAGEWWVATNSGLYRFPHVGRLEQLASARPLAVYTKSDGLADNYISRLFEDTRGDIWIGTFNPPEMLTRWERSTGKFYRYSERDSLPALNWTNVFAGDSAGDLWIGLHNGGLVRYKDGRFETFGAAEGVPMGFGQGLYFDHEGRLWIATRGGGTGRIDDPLAPRPKATPFVSGGDLSSENLRCFTEDTLGNIYIGTARGVDRLTPATGQVKHFTVADGLIKSEVMVAFRDPNGTLWFGTRDGLSRLTPEVEGSQKPPPVLISGLRIAGVPYPVSELGETEVSGIVLSSGQNQIEVDFFGLGFSTGESLRYQYMLEGLDRDWNEPTDQRTVTASLAPGKYRLLVRAITASGLKTEKPAVVSFTILRPIWQRWWFVTLSLLLMTAIVYAIYRYRVRRIIELERVRTRIATDLHDDMGASLSQIAILSEVVGQRVEEDNSPVREPMMLIADTSREMVGSMSDIVWAINPERDHLRDLVQRMRRFAGDILNARDIDFRFLAPAAERDLKLGADLRREIYLIFKESINNLVKHSGGTEAEMEFKVERGWIIIRISDNGRGFDVKDASEKGYEGGGGHGLNSLRRRAAALGGSYSIESSPGQGTSVTLSVPLSGHSTSSWKNLLRRYVGRSRPPLI